MNRVLTGKGKTEKSIKVLNQGNDCMKSALSKAVIFYLMQQKEMRSLYMIKGPL